MRLIDEYLDKLPQPERVNGVVMDMHEPFRMFGGIIEWKVKGLPTTKMSLSVM